MQILYIYSDSDSDNLGILWIIETDLQTIAVIFFKFRKNVNDYLIFSAARTQNQVSLSNTRINRTSKKYHR